MDTPTEAVFDRLTRLAAHLTNTPVSLVSLVDGNRQWFKSIVGLPDPWASRRETPLSHSFCQHVVIGQKPLVVSDAREIDFLKDNLAIPDLNVIGYLGMPLTTSDGYTMGSLCVIDSQPRQWSDKDLAVLEDLAATTISLIEMRAQIMNMTTISEGRLRNAMTQLAQVESYRKEEIQHHRSVVNHAVQLLEQNRPSQDVLTFLKSAQS
jgi:hypothetical protein